MSEIRGQGPGGRRRTALLRVSEVTRGLVPPVNLAWLAARHRARVADRICLSGDAVPGTRLLSLRLVLDQVPADYIGPRTGAVGCGYPDHTARRTKIAARAVRPAFADVLAAVDAASG